MVEKKVRPRDGIRDLLRPPAGVVWGLCPRPSGRQRSTPGIYNMWLLHLPYCPRDLELVSGPEKRAKGGCGV